MKTQAILCGTFDNPRRTLHRRAVMATLLATTVLGGSVANAQTTKDKDSGATTLGEVIVTATKRAENIQHVAASIQALDTRKLDQLNITEFQDYVKFLPSVSFQTEGPNQTQIYFRGVASGENANHSGPLPSVGAYLDEQPITTIGGTLDVHIYDVARVEALAGPQGTLYGASSEAGTLRIITNKPTTSGFSAAIDVEGNTTRGDEGYVVEGYVNIPLASNMAVRLVGWDEHDAGFIDNVAGSRTFLTSGATISNAPYVKKNFNPADTYGGRAALKIDLDSNWSITPSVIAQDQRNTGVFGYEPNVGYLKVQRFQPDTDHDRWVQAALTVTGKLSKMDVTYSGGYFVRQQDTQSDYTDYSIAYDGVYGSGSYWQDSHGNALNKPLQEIIGKDRFTKQSHELRIASPATDRFRLIAGLFTQRQSHWIIQDYEIQGFGTQLAVPGWANTIWLTDEMRIDRDNAVFGEFAYDVTDHLTVTGGVRFYNYKNSLEGFFGFGGGYDALLGSSTGQASCVASAAYRGAPCINLNKTVQGNGETHKLNVTYKFDSQKLAYFTYSTGFRPGGVNRAGALPPYGADYLSNYELGWKTSWFDHKLRFNGAVYEEEWDNFQFSFLGQYSLTQIQNAGSAQVRGIETDFSYSVTPQLTVSGSGAYNDARLTQPYCATNLVACPGAGNFVYAKAGTELPVTPRYKANATVRYTADVADWKGHAQGSIVYASDTTPGLRNIDETGTTIGFPPGNSVVSTGLGGMPAYTTADFSIGAERGGFSLELFVKNAFDAHGDVTKYTPCTTKICTATASSVTGATLGSPLPEPAIYVVPIQPRLIGIKVGKKF